MSSTSSLSVANQTYVDGGHFDLDAGTYLVIAHSEWASNSTGARSHCINTSVASSSNSTSFVHSGRSSGVVRLTSMVMLHPTQTTTYYLVLYQNSGGSLNSSARKVRVVQLA